MKPVVAQTLRSRWLATLVHVALWLLLLLAVMRIGGHPPVFTERDGSSPPNQPPVPVAKLDRLFTTEPWPVVIPSSNSPSAFFTRHFIPPVAPSPPPPTTKKISLVYHGFYSIEGGGTRTLVKSGEEFLSAPVGGKLTANLYVANASLVSLLLTNSTGQTNLLMLNTSKEVEVPIK